MMSQPHGGSDGVVGVERGMLGGRKTGRSWYGVVVVESMVDAGEEGRVVVRGGQFGSGAVSAWQMLVVSVLVFLVLGQWLVGMCAVYPVA